MSFSSRIRQCTLPLIAVAISTSLLATSPAFANGPPVVVVNGAGGGQIQLNNPLRFEGTAKDSDRIKNLFGTIQDTKSGKFIGQNGRASKKAENIKFKFEKSKATNWSSQSFNLPRGRYVFNLRVVDGANNVSERISVPFIATGAEGANNYAAAPVTNQRTVAGGAAPRIAIKFPKNGDTLNKASAFSGTAKDDRAVVRVVATVMNKANGSFLTSDGKFATRGELTVRTIKGKSAQWSTPQVKLPPGNYLLSVKAIDNDGQEGQWTQSNFSIVKSGQGAATTEPVVTTAAVVAGATAANGLAYCNGNGLDADGDGFGWQNNASCVVAGSKADTHPTCASSSSDPDGDGYGWENEKSCIVVVHCQSGDSDADGDGFGWENNRSCIVLKQTSNSRFPACAKGAASDPDGDGYGWENNNTCLVK